MNRKMKTRLASISTRWAALVVSLLLLLSVLPDSAVAANVPSPAPDFSLEDLTGRTITLGGLRGKDVLLLFGTAGCPHCGAAFTLLDSVSETAGDELQILFIAVGQTTQELADAFCSDAPLYGILPDHNRAVSSSYSIERIPTCVFIDQQGLIQYYGQPSEEIIWRLLSGERLTYSDRPEQDIPDSPTVPTCALYTVGQQPGHRSQLLALDLRNRQSYLLGDLVEAEIQALAVHPQTGVLYAVTDKWGKQPGLLYSVDRATGEMTPIGPHGFKSITALAFRWTDDTLWGWAEGAGLIQIDTTTGVGSLHFASKEKLSGLAWANDDSLLYACDRTSLWSYRDADASLEPVADNLPRGSIAIEMRSDGVLVGIGRKDDSGGSGDKGTHPLDQAWVFIYDPNNHGLVSHTAIGIPRVYPGFAGLAWPRACGNPSPGGPADIIEGITLDKTELCPGDHLLVTVEAAHPESPQGKVDLTINGRWGSPQYLQFTGAPGPRIVVVAAGTPEKHSDIEQVTIEVMDCGDDYEFLEATVRPNPFQRHAVDFEIANAAEFSGQNPVYVWDFGDSQSLQTTVPYAAHSYEAALVRDRLYSGFQATITLQRSGLADLTTRKTITLWNAYALNRRKGIIEPPVESDEYMQQSGPSWMGSYTITNLEDEPIRFTSRWVTYQHCDPDQEPISLPAETIFLEVPGLQPMTQQLQVPASQISSDICGVGVSLSGQDQQGRLVRASSYLTVRRNPVMTRPVYEQALRQLLNQIAAQGLVSDPFHITDEDLYRLARQRKIAFPVPPSAPPSVQTARVRAAGLPNCDMTPCQPDPGNPNKCVGKPCVPGDTPPRPGLSCQVTGEWCIAPPHIANARKGDAILSAGCGMIGDLLRRVSPAQKYSHSGIMTRNYYQVTHSTSSEQRYEDNMVGIEGSDGFNEMVLRYGWPGVITQSVDEAFNGQWRIDPSGAPYLLVGFHADPARCDGDTELVWPKVVKPPPGAPPSVRQQLQAAADVALATSGHYRFYAFSDAGIVYNPAYYAPQDAGWAAGTLPTVCSQFVWYSLKQAGIQLEGPRLEEADVNDGAERDELTLDGLYLYREDERENAAWWLHGELYDKVFGIEGWFGELILDAADNISNQFCNCMGWDGCSINDNDSEAWKHPGVGRAVSPQDILFWDGPDTGGVYGYQEYLVYRGGDYVAENTWQVSEGVGTFAGRVLDRGNLVPDASVTIAGLELFTDTNGEFKDEMIPAGTYEVVASKFIEGFFLSVREEVTIKSGETTWVDLILQPPPEYIRRVVIEGSVYIRDHETWPADDETGLFSIYEARTLDIFQRDAMVVISHCVGDEVRVELRFHLHLKEQGNTTVTLYRVDHDGKYVHAWLYEGTDCDTDDLEAWGWWHPTGDIAGILDVPAGAVMSLEPMHLENNEVGSPDYADIVLSVKNEQQTFPPAAPSPEDSDRTNLESQVPDDPHHYGVAASWQAGECFSVAAVDACGHVVTQADYDRWVTLGSPDCWCDPCHCRGDANGDCAISTTDTLALRAAWPGSGGTYDPCVDTNYDGVIDTIDVLALRGAWPGLGGPGCSGCPPCP